MIVVLVDNGGGTRNAPASVAVVEGAAHEDAESRGGSEISCRGGAEAGVVRDGGRRWSGGMLERWTSLLLLWRLLVILLLLLMLWLLVILLLGHVRLLIERHFGRTSGTNIGRLLNRPEEWRGRGLLGGGGDRVGSRSAAGTGGTGSEPRALARLLLGTFHLEAEVGLVAVEPFVAVGAGVGALCDATEAVEVQLPLEGCQLGMPKIPRQNLIHEPFIVPHRKGVPIGKKRHDGRLLLSQHVHQLAGKGVGMPVSRRVCRR